MPPLRAVALGAGGAMLLGALACFWLDSLTPLIPILVLVGILCLIGGFVDVARPVYKQYLDAPPDASWRQTGERFLDSASRKTIEVYIQPASGERAYVAVEGTERL